MLLVALCPDDNSCAEDQYTLGHFPEDYTEAAENEEDDEIDRLLNEDRAANESALKYAK